jgi:cytochrome d ubiquinol oxidase subunit I
MLLHAMAFAAIAVPLQILAGDLRGLNVGEHQPVKLAAMEAHWHDAAPGEGTPLVLFAVPDGQAERNDYEVAVPRLGGLILKHDWNGTIAPLTAVPRSERPPVAPVFYAFRVMVGLGLAMLALVLAGLVLWRRGRVFETRWYLRAWVVLAPAGFVAVLAGWYTAEIGRQPWLIHGLFRTVDGFSGNVAAGSVLASLVTFAVVYAILFGFGTWYLLKMMRRGPVAAPPRDDPNKTPARPMSAADESAESPP